MALNGLVCVEVLLRHYSLSHSLTHLSEPAVPAVTVQVEVGCVGLVFLVFYFWLVFYYDFTSLELLST